MSIHDKLSRVRKPRVHIKYEVETEGATVEKELPFVVGVIGDYSGNQPGEPLKPLKERKFIHIDRDNFNDVMEKSAPGINIRVNNKLNPETDSELAVQLQFRSIEDFEPAKVVEQIPALKQLKDMRDQLRDLLSKSDRSPELEKILEDVLENTEKFDKLVNELAGKFSK